MMRYATLVLAGALVLIGGLVYFGTRSLPVNSALIEKVIPNDRFSR